MSLPKKIQEIYRTATCLYNKQEIEVALDEMALAIHDELALLNPVLLTVLKGGIVLVGNLLPRLDFPLEIDNVHATRYQGAVAGGELIWKIKPEVPLRDRVILILDDILDLGITLAAVVAYCQEQGAKKVYTGVLVDKKVTRSPVGLAKADFVALTVEDRFIFGYGLDYQEYLRNAPGIYEVAADFQG